MLSAVSPRIGTDAGRREHASARREYWLTARRAVPRSWYALKRFGDLVVSAVLLAALAPLFVLVAIAIRLTSLGPAFFSQLRVGKDGKAFRLYKFRTMVDGAHLLHDHVRHLNEIDGPALKISNDPRLHGLGAFLRRTSLDELPQLWNVLRGDMSMVGPRPALPAEVQHYEPHYLQRLTVMPGVSGLWQVSGRARVPFRRWMAMDIWYARNWSPFVDAAIVVRTLPAVFRGDGAC